MKVRASIKRMCNQCRVVRRNGVLRIVCKNVRHKQRQG
ncbi:MAG: 50S ribosomal protein L36 [Lentisphaeria bacterium]